MQQCIKIYYCIFI